MVFFEMANRLIKDREQVLKSLPIDFCRNRKSVVRSFDSAQKFYPL